MSSEHTAFSTSGEDAISRTIDVQIDDTADQLSSAEEFSQFYEIERTVEELVKGDYKRIALQFPDSLLHDSVPIYRILKPKIGVGRELYVLADTSYGSCCVDEVAAQHVDADAMVHYGHACMSQTYRLPVIYVFGKKPLDVDDCVSRLVTVFQPSSSAGEDREESKRRKLVILRHDVVYTHQAELIFEKLRQILEPLQIQVLYSNIPTKLDPAPGTGHTPLESGQLHPATTPPAEIPSEDCTIFYIGSESLGLTNLLMTHASCEVYSYNPSTKTARLESSQTNKLLMRRYAVVQKARDADVFGILVGTLGVASYLPLISHIRALLARARKKSYTISVGKLNPSKLANFMEIECFVLVACPENSLVEAKEFLRPIVTPYELEVALQAEQTWTGRYVLDFEKLLAEAALSRSDDHTSDGEDGKESEDPDQPVFSLITGKYRHAKRYGGAQPNEADAVEGPLAVILRNQDGTVAKLSDSAAGQFLQGRTYQGLETRVGQDAPSVLEQGRSGIARGYQDDHKV